MLCLNSWSPHFGQSKDCFLHWSVFSCFCSISQPSSYSPYFFNCWWLAGQWWDNLLRKSGNQEFCFWWFLSTPTTHPKPWFSFCFPRMLTTLSSPFLSIYLCHVAQNIGTNFLLILFQQASQWLGILRASRWITLLSLASRCLPSPGTRSHCFHPIRSWQLLIENAYLLMKGDDSRIPAKYVLRKPFLLPTNSFFFRCRKNFLNTRIK